MRATRSWSRRRAPSWKQWGRGYSPRRRRGSGCSCTDVAGIPIYQTAIQPEWIDFNGHLRDAYYTLIFSLGVDALMDRVGLDAPYRQRTRCTLYTVEMHLHYLRELKHSDTAAVQVRILGADHKRIHAAAEAMLLHVRQDGETVKSAPFPGEVSAAIAQLSSATAGMESSVPGSRRMQLRSAGGTA